MFKRINEIERRIRRMREIAKEVTGYDLIKVIGVGRNEIYFKLEGYYQEFLQDGVIEVTIREETKDMKENFYLFQEKGYLKIEQVVEYDGVTYFIIFEKTNFEKSN